MFIRCQNTAQWSLSGNCLILDCDGLERNSRNTAFTLQNNPPGMCTCLCVNDQHSLLLNDTPTIITCGDALHKNGKPETVMVSFSTTWLKFFPLVKELVNNSLFWFLLLSISLRLVLVWQLLAPLSVIQPNLHKTFSVICCSVVTSKQVFPRSNF